MGNTVKGGLAIGLLCAAWVYVMGFTGWYRDPAMTSMFWVVVLIEIGVLVWALRKTPPAGWTYGALLRQGSVMALIGGVVIFFSSLLFTAVVFPDYFAELRALEAEMLRGQGMTADQITAAQQATAWMQTPLANAFTGFLGTFVTGVLATLVIAAFLKRK